MYLKLSGWPSHQGCGQGDKRQVEWREQSHWELSWGSGKTVCALWGSEPSERPLSHSWADISSAPCGPAFRVSLVTVLGVGKRLSIAMASGKFYENRLMLCMKCVLVCIHLCGHLDFGITGTWWLSCQLGEGSNKIIIYKFLEASRNQRWIVIWGTVGESGWREERQSN